MTPEALARICIDQLLQAAGWQVHDLKQANIHATTGVAIREFPLNPGHGFADYKFGEEFRGVHSKPCKKRGSCECRSFNRAHRKAAHFSNTHIGYYNAQYG